MRIQIEILLSSNSGADPGFFGINDNDRPNPGLFGINDPARPPF